MFERTHQHHRQRGSGYGVNLHTRGSIRFGVARKPMKNIVNSRSLYIRCIGWLSGGATEANEALR